MTIYDTTGNKTKKINGIVYALTINLSRYIVVNNGTNVTNKAETTEKDNTTAESRDWFELAVEDIILIPHFKLADITGNGGD